MNVFLYVIHSWRKMAFHVLMSPHETTHSLTHSLTVWNSFDILSTYFPDSYHGTDVFYCRELSELISLSE